MLVVVVGGNIDTGFTQVSNIQKVQQYIEKLYPYILFTVKTPELIKLNINIRLISKEDSMANRQLISDTIKDYFDKKVQPDMEITNVLIKSLIIDGINITDAQAEIDIGDRYYNQLEYAVLGEITWN